MRLLLKQLTVCVASASLALSGCVTTPGGGANGGGVKVGPQLSSAVETEKAVETVDPAKPRLDIVVPVFDPGLTEAAANYEEDNVWPDLRRAEANRFAWKMKQALEQTGAFGAVRVTPDATATGDLYVLGKIVESDGENVEIAIEVADISGNRWFGGVFDHEVESGFHQNVRNKGTDPYDPVFAEAAARIAAELRDRGSAELADLQKISELRFAANLTEEAFAGHLTKDRDRFALAGFPAEADPMLTRVRAVRVRDQLFVDGLQEHYRDFSGRMDTSYLVWQEQSLLEIEARRKAEWDAAGEAALGVLAIGLAILAIAAGGRTSSQTGQTAAVAGGIIGGVAGASLISGSFQTSKQAEVHRDALNELGKSIDIDMAPQVVASEKETVELTGTAREQFAQWRAFLKKIYEEERTPAVQL
jgi:hypothetical protein